MLWFLDFPNYMYIHTHAHIHTRTHTHMNTHTHEHIHAHTHTIHKLHTLSTTLPHSLSHTHWHTHTDITHTHTPTIHARKRKHTNTLHEHCTQQYIFSVYCIKDPSRANSKHRRPSWFWTKNLKKCEILWHFHKTDTFECTTCLNFCQTIRGFTFFLAKR